MDNDDKHDVLRRETDMLRRETGEVFKRRATDFDRVEMLAVALDAFARAVPDYEPHFHVQAMNLLHRRKS